MMIMPLQTYLVPLAQGDWTAHSGKCFQAGGRASTWMDGFRHLFPFPLDTFPGPALAQPWPPAFRPSPDLSGPSFPPGF